MTKLMQRGVDIQQIRRVRRKYEGMAKEGNGYGAKGSAASTNSRMRKNNGALKNPVEGTGSLDSVIDDCAMMPRGAISIKKKNIASFLITTIKLSSLKEKNMISNI